jgi:Nif-specific regulatory protein
MWDTRTTSALLEASKAITGTLDLRPALQAIADQAAVVMRSEGSSVLLLDRRKKRFTFEAASGCKAENLIGEEFDASLGIAGSVVRSGRSVLVNDVRAEKSFFEGIDSKIDFTTRNLICAPMVYRDELIGVIEVLNRVNGEAFDPADLNVLDVFANLAAIGAVNARRYEELKRANQSLHDSVLAHENIVGSSGSLRHVMGLVGKVAPTNATALLLGETGTGKELVAKTIHQLSLRNGRPFVAINCAALPETLLESELFGHEKGAFTGAVAQKLGRFELADGGTIFLDEVGELSGSIQVKLLRFLQEKEFVRVGGTRTIATDIRIIAATNCDLKQAMHDGKFREDLYYRLNVFPIVLPPLRDRREDIPELLDHYIDKTSRELNVVRPELSDEAREQLIGYDWPGNIRELQNVVERAVLLASGETISPEHLPREIVDDGPGGEGTSSAHTGLTLFEQETRLIRQALEKHNWNKSHAAEALGITRDLLRYRIKKYDIRQP